MSNNTLFIRTFIYKIDQKATNLSYLRCVYLTTSISTLAVYNDVVNSKVTPMSVIFICVSARSNVSTNLTFQLASVSPTNNKCVYKIMYS